MLKLSLFFVIWNAGVSVSPHSRLSPSTGDQAIYSQTEDDSSSIASAAMELPISFPRLEEATGTSAGSSSAVSAAMGLPIPSRRLGEGTGTSAGSSSTAIGMGLPIPSRRLGEGTGTSRSSSSTVSAAMGLPIPSRNLGESTSTAGEMSVSVSPPIFEEGESDNMDILDSMLSIPERRIEDFVAVNGISLVPGGMSDVEVMRDLSDDSLVVLKSAHTKRDRILLNREYRVLETFAGESHPNVVLLKGVILDEQDDVKYLITEYKAGGSLFDILSTLTVKEKKKIFLDICEGIEFLHKRGISHLDLKPENVVLFKDGSGNWVAAIIDFGTAKQGRFITIENGASEDFMAPEACKVLELGKIIDGFAADTFSLGVMLYVIFFEEMPLEYRSIEEAAQMYPKIIYFYKALTDSLPYNRMQISQLKTQFVSEFLV